MGVESPKVVFTGYDTLWVYTKRFLLHSTDGGKTWTKRLLGNATPVFSIEPYLSVEGASLWMANGCKVSHSTDAGKSWRHSPNLPGCSDDSDDYDSRADGLYVFEGQVWVWTSENLFVLDHDFRRWTLQYGRDSDAASISHFLASEQYLWLATSDGRLLYALRSAPRKWQGSGRSFGYNLQFSAAAADTVWLAVLAEGMPTTVVGEGILWEIVVGDGLRAIERSKLPRDGLGPISPRKGFSWRRDEQKVYRRDESGQWHVVMNFEGRDDAVVASSNRVLVIHYDELVVLDTAGIEISRLYEPTSPAICAVEKRGEYWYAISLDGQVLQTDSTFLWGRPPTEDSDTTLQACSIDESVIWAIESRDGKLWISRKAQSPWQRVRELLHWDELPVIDEHWIHTLGKHVWATAGGEDHVMSIMHSPDAGRTWTSAAVPGVDTIHRIHGSRAQVWAIGNLGAKNDRRVLAVLQGRRYGQEHLILPDQALDAWISGDSIWAIGGDNSVRISADWGKTWQRRTVPTDGAALRSIHSTPVGLIVTSETSSGLNNYTSGDGGRTWKQEWDFAGSIPRSGIDTLRWLHSGNMGLGIAVARTIYPRPTRYRIKPGIRGVRLDIALDTSQVRGASIDSLSFELAGVDAHDFARGEYDPFPSACTREKDVTRWSCSFSPERAGIRPGEKGHLELTLQLGHFRHAFSLEPFTFRPWWQRLPKPLLWGGVVYAALVALAALLWVFRPLWLHRLYWTLQRHTETLPWGASGTSNAILNVLLPYFAHHPRVLDAWVETHAAKVDRAFREIDPRLIPPEQYVPLPVTVLRRAATNEDTLIAIRTIGEPAAAHFRPLFESERTLLEVVGTGGSGKTTLALRLASWALHGSPAGKSREMDGLEDRLADHRMLPVWVNEETTDVLSVAARQLTVWTQEQLSEDFVRVLLHRGRVLLVVDRLSERTAQTQSYFRRAAGQLRIRRTIVTSRSPITFEAPVTTYLGTRELTFDSLARLVAARLAAADPDPNRGTEELPRPHPSWDPEKQAELVARIARVFRVPPGGDEGGTIALHPLLVRLAVDESIRLRKQGAPPAALAASIPRLVENYLISLNPPDADETPLSHSAMLRAAQLLATLELGTEFRPRTFSRAQARREFAAHGWDIDSGPDPLQRLVLNGVLVDEGASYMRFRYDPIAEYVAAAAAVQEKAHDPDAWEMLLSSVKAAGAVSYLQTLRAFFRLQAAKVDLATPGSE